MKSLVRAVSVVGQVFGLLVGRDLADPLRHAMGEYQSMRSGR